MLYPGQQIRWIVNKMVLVLLVWPAQSYLAYWVTYSTSFPTPQLYCAIHAKKSLQFPWHNCRRKTPQPNEIIQTFIKWHVQLYKKA